MTIVDQGPAERVTDECKPWCSPKHYRFCGGPCCPHLHRGDEPSDGKDAGGDPARTTGRTHAGV